MTSIQARSLHFLFALALAAVAAPLAATQAQGFASVSSSTPNASSAASAGAATGPGPAPVTLAATIAPAASTVPTPAPIALPPPTGSAAGVVGVAPPVAAAGTVAPGIPAPTAAVTPSSGTFSSGSGGFHSVSGGAPSLPAPPTASANLGAGSTSAFEMADKVVVIKHQRVLRLLRRGRVIAEYPIKLGLNPYGHKQREGDFRTPEGKYELVSRNPRSEFFLSIKISYPNREDAAVAHESGFEPGGLIMIHGQPNEPKRPVEHYATRDWTDGCIALSNADMVDVWLRTTAGIPIDIRK